MPALEIPRLGRGLISAPRQRFPLRVSANRRYLQCPDGSPFRVQCSAAWLASTRSTASEWATYLADRKARGFNTVILMAIVQSGYTAFGTGSEPANRAGAQPFTSTGDFSTPNAAYFDYLETLVAMANAAGVCVFLFYTYWGFGGPSPGDQGWWNQLSSNSLGNCTAWGAYLGNRLKKYPNIILGSGGDYTADPVGDASNIAKTVAILNGIRSAGGYAAQWPAGNEWNNPDTLAQAQGGFSYGPDPATSDQQLGTFYACGPNIGTFTTNGYTYVTAALSFGHATRLPSIGQEGCYVGENNLTGINGTRVNIRKYQNWLVLGGSTAGQCFGQHYEWNWETAGPTLWSDTLNSLESQDISRSFKLYDTIGWHRHLPSGTASGFAGRDLIVSGAGSGDQAVISSIDELGFSLLAYRASDGTGTQGYSVDLRSMAGPVAGWWFNPTSGDTLPEQTSGGEYVLSNGTASQAFTTPGNNGTGENDWFLLLRSKG
jgi:hypothetical protein